MNRLSFKILTIILVLSISLIANGSIDSRPTYPSHLLQLQNHFAHHVLVAEKSTHKLYLYNNEGTFPKLIKIYDMATGKKAGDKMFQGDHKTPEGIYQFTRFIPHKELITTRGKRGEIYGVGAFVLDYPNPIDVMAGKTGGGIWLHSTNDETRIEKGLDSRGCVVIANKDLQDISQYIELDKTAIVIVHDMYLLNNDSFNQSRKNLKQFISTWQKSWQNESIEDYISHYDPKEFYDRFRGGFKKFKAYKKAVFSNEGSPEIKIGELSIFQSRSYATLIFLQHYKSNTIQDTGKKILYLKKDDFYNWKIVAEKWQKIDAPTENSKKVSFRPSMRFFKSGDKSSKQLNN